MALLTLGSNANNSLNALLMGPGVGAGGKMNATDFAALQQAILDDQGNAHAIWPGALAASMWLEIPNRGRLRVKAGDYIGVDSTGWPILLSARAIASGPWTHS